MLKVKGPRPTGSERYKRIPFREGVLVAAQGSIFLYSLLILREAYHAIAWS